jgi:hypothetical protein
LDVKAENSSTRLEVTRHDQSHRNSIGETLIDPTSLVGLRRRVFVEIHRIQEKAPHLGSDTELRRPECLSDAQIFEEEAGRHLIDILVMREIAQRGDPARRAPA